MLRIEATRTDGASIALDVDEPYQLDLVDMLISRILDHLANVPAARRRAKEQPC